MRPFLLAVCVVVCVLLDVGRANAQLTEATLIGKVVDATGQTIPYASNSVARQETGQKRDILGDRDGGFTRPGLTPGSYDVEVQSDGFRVARQPGLRLSVGQTTVTIRLELAALQETVTVSASASCSSPN